MRPIWADSKISNWPVTFESNRKHPIRSRISKLRRALYPPCLSCTVNVLLTNQQTLRLQMHQNNNINLYQKKVTTSSTIFIFDNCSTQKSHILCRVGRRTIHAYSDDCTVRPFYKPHPVVGLFYKQHPTSAAEPKASNTKTCTNNHFTEHSATILPYIQKDRNVQSVGHSCG